MRLRQTVIAVVLCGFGVAPLGAQERTGPDDDSKSSWFYLGANYGWYKARGGDFDDESDLIEGMVGYHFTPNIGVEASVIDFGRFGDRLADADVDGWTLGASLRLPLTRTTGLYAKTGLLFWDAAVSAADDVDEAVDDSDWFYGAGVDFRFNPMISINAEYVRYKVDIDGSGFATPVRGDTDIDAAKIGLRLTF